MELMVEASTLEKDYRRSDGSIVKAVDGIDLEIRKGEIFSLLGPNGAGKTTTISMLAGLIEPSSGEIKIGAYSLVEEPIQAKRLIGIVPQEVALYPSLSARQNLVFFARMYDMKGALLQDRVQEVLEFIDLRGREDDRVETYSGGMKRRVNIGAGLIHKPKLVFMDEPTVGIDPQSRRQILDTVKQLRDEFGMTILYTTHLMEEAQELSDRVAIIDFGKIIAQGTQAELIQMVGEEDMLLLSVGSQEITPDLLDRIQDEIEGITGAVYDPPALSADDGETDDGVITVTAKRGRKALPDLIQLVYVEGVDIHSVEVREPDLEAVFLKLTGRALRE